MFAVPMIQNLETTLRAGAVPHAPQFRPSPVQSIPEASKKPNGSSESIQTRPQETATASNGNTNSTRENTVPPAVIPAETPPQDQKPKPMADPLGDARSKVQEEIGKEFAAIMASGTFRASEAAALATKKVMQKYGHMKVQS